MPFSPLNFSFPSRLFLLLLLIPLSVFLFSLRRSIPSPHNVPLSPHTGGFTATAAATAASTAVIDARRLFLSLSSSANSSISSHLRSLTLQPHLAGTSTASVAAVYVRSQLELAGLQTLTRNYSAFLSYPAAASLALLNLNGTLIKSFSLAEPADPAGRMIPPYHSYSPSGAVIAPAIYANLGRDEDYLMLDRLGFNVHGCVVVVRRGGGPRGAIVEKAADRGAKAVLMFGNGHGGGVERGTVLLGGPGDPLTPGWAAGSTTERLPLEDGEVRRRFPKIPSMPVSFDTAKEILGLLGGPLVPAEWSSEMPSVVSIGGGPTVVNFTYQVNFLDSEEFHMIMVDRPLLGTGFLSFFALMSWMSGGGAVKWYA